MGKPHEEVSMQVPASVSKKPIDLTNVNEHWIVTEDGMLIPGSSDSPMNLRKERFA